MQKLIPEILDALDRGECCELVTVLEKRGSAPRGAGACLLVRENDASRGTIGGGSVENAAEREARTLLAARVDGVREYRIETGEAEDLGMICGGAVRVLFHCLQPDAKTRTAFLALADGSAMRLIRTVRGGAVVSLAVGDGAGRRPTLTETDGTLVFSEPVAGDGRVIVFGGGHVAAALVPVLARVGFRVTVVDDRADFVTRERFPDAESLVHAPFSEAGTRLSIGAEDWVAVMTRGHQADYEILTQVLRTQAVYIGCIGSRHKIEKTKSRLLADGFTETDFARVHTPIGLPIGAETPEEIAVSIAAEMIQCRAGL